MSTPSFTAGEAISAGDVVYIDYDGVSGPEVLKADATVAGKRDPCGVALNGVGGGGTVYVATAGQKAVINTVIAATNEGEPVYLTGVGAGDSAGEVTLTPPQKGVGGWVAGDVSQIIGVVALTGAAGTAEILVQMRESIDL